MAFFLDSLLPCGTRQNEAKGKTAKIEKKTGDVYHMYNVRQRWIPIGNQYNIAVHSPQHVSL